MSGGFFRVSRNDVHNRSIYSDLQFLVLCVSIFFIFLFFSYDMYFDSQGTSADQDTRFSNKQAKLLKSQKFPPELDNLVSLNGFFS